MVVVVFVLFPFLVVEHDIPFSLLNVGLEKFVGRVGQLATLIQLALKTVLPNVWVAIGHANVLSFGL